VRLADEAEREIVTLSEAKSKPVAPAESTLEPAAGASAGKRVLPPLGATVALLAPPAAHLVDEEPGAVGSAAMPVVVPVPDPGPEPVRAWEAETVLQADSGAEKTQDPPRIAGVETSALSATTVHAGELCAAAVQAINTAETVRFGRGETDLDGHSRGVLDRFAATANGCPGVDLRVIGHADARGKAKRNLALSEERARAVVTYLIDKGIDAGRLKAVGYGEAHPVAPNDTAENRAKNRRIELAITGSSPTP
jgi:outer membrane protein OmpA-like peptidoglycan-associated protein